MKPAFAPPLLDGCLQKAAHSAAVDLKMRVVWCYVCDTTGKAANFASWQRKPFGSSSGAKAAAAAGSGASCCTLPHPHSCALLTRDPASQTVAYILPILTTAAALSWLRCRRHSATFDLAASKVSETWTRVVLDYI